MMEGYAIFDRVGFVVYQRTDAIGRFFTLGEVYHEFTSGDWRFTGNIGIVNLDTGRVVTRRGH